MTILICVLIVCMAAGLIAAILRLDKMSDALEEAHWLLNDKEVSFRTHGSAPWSVRRDKWNEEVKGLAKQ